MVFKTVPDYENMTKFKVKSEFGGQHFFGPDDEIFYVLDQVFYLKFANLNLESSFYLIFVILIFHGPTLGHVSGNVSTCHMVGQQMKMKGLGKLTLREL